MLAQPPLSFAEQKAQTPSIFPGYGPKKSAGIAPGPTWQRPRKPTLRVEPGMARSISSSSNHQYNHSLRVSLLCPPALQPPYLHGLDIFNSCFVLLSLAPDRTQGLVGLPHILHKPQPSPNCLPHPPQHCTHTLNARAICSKRASTSIFWRCRSSCVSLFSRRPRSSSASSCGGGTSTGNRKGKKCRIRCPQNIQAQGFR